LLADKYVSSGLPSTTRQWQITSSQMQKAYDLEGKQRGAGERYLDTFRVKHYAETNRWLDRLAKVNGLKPEEVGLILAHNHPSGFANPSGGDIFAGKSFVKGVPRVKYDVVVDHRHFGSIKYETRPDGSIKATPRVYSIDPEVTMPGDLRSAPTIPHQALGEIMIGPRDTRTVAELFDPGNTVTAILTDTNSRVAAVVGIPSVMFSEFPFMTNRGRGRVERRGSQPAVFAMLR
ncbi:unnamed protein product, partial [marine sediment metagenome]